MRKSKFSFLKYLFSIKTFLYTTMILLFFCLSISIGFFANLVKSQDILSYEEMNKKLNNISMNSSIYFSNGEKVSTINSELIRKAIPLSEMGENIQNAIIASEDASFYSNIGVDPVAIVRASYSEIRGKSISGGSTITQQLVKNQLLDSSRSYERKAKEILVSLRTNSYFSKEQILESYLNMVPFGKNKLGQNISGIETAANGIFGIKSSELNIAQAAYLAGFVQSPFKYTPFDSNGNLRNDEELVAGFERQKYVLNRMLSNNYITQDEYNEALQFDIKSSFIDNLENEYVSYPYITDEVIKEASFVLAKEIAKKEGKLAQFTSNIEYRANLIEETKLKFVTGGYKVNTTIDKGLYDTLNQAKNNYSGFLSQNGQNMEIGASLIENSTGKILAFIGGRNYETQQLNHSTSTYRSPGSTIKPLLVYAPAIEKGYITPNSMLLDKKFTIGSWKPENFAKVEYNLVSAKTALAKSLNLSTIRLYSAFYQENPMKEYLKKMDFDKITNVDETTLASSIGGLQYGVTVTQNTNAFATLANGGNFIQSHMINNIEDKDGHIVYSYQINPVRVYSENTSYLITNMLNDVISYNGSAPDIASSLKFNQSNLFVKTGTSEYNHDLWTIGGSTNITFGLWTGYDQPQTINGFSHAHSQWAYFMNIINDYDPNIILADKPFTKPQSIVYRNINQMNNDNGTITDLVPNDFKILSEDMMYKKFGLNIDQNTKNLIYKKDEEEEKEKEKEEVDKKENNTTAQSTSSSNNNTRKIIIVAEDKEDNNNP